MYIVLDTFAPSEFLYYR